LLAIRRQIEVEYLIGLEVCQLNGLSTNEGLLPEIGDAVARGDVNEIATVRTPVNSIQSEREWNIKGSYL
jgi:hypothetical protein